MNYTSTRSILAASSAKAIASGIAPDGGLYTPTEIPALTLEDLVAMQSLSYSELAADVLARFMTDFTKEELLEYARLAYDSGRFLRPGTDSREAVGLRELHDGEHLLELYFGPTSAFKDMALQIMPRLLTASLKKLGEERGVCILVATSGDTGKAALEGFRDVEGTRIGVYFPDGGVSEIQRMQMETQEGSNVRVWAVQGNFDDCQTGVKNIFASADANAEIGANGIMLSSANSINWGRLAPQIVYYIWSYLELCKRGDISMGQQVNVCVPTGNFGNILAAYIARRMGMPFSKLICASNANNVLTDFIKTGVYDRRRTFYRTLSPSMDILISSNVERLLYYLTDGDTAYVAEKMQELKETGTYTLTGKALEELQSVFLSGCCDDEMTADTIRDVWEENHCLIDTHTAVAVRVLRDILPEYETIIASTASAYKFSDGVLAALTGDHADGFDAIDRLQHHTGSAVPAPLDSLRGRAVRFDTVIEKDRMESAAVDFCRSFDL
ncbi:MAG: threonine synthase [Ruminococcaceae bacterium]|nr:threonine synthase [Oscillospiraceae bacterium]